MSRLAPLDLDALTPEQRTVADHIVESRGGLRGPFEAWLRSPAMADRALYLGHYLRFDSALPPDLKELAILLTGKHWRAQFEFWAHARLAREAGLPDAVIEAIRTGQEPSLDGEPLRATYALVTEHFRTNRVSDDTYDRALAAVGEQGLVELIGLVTYYGFVSMTLNVFNVGLPEGEQPLLA